MTTDSKNLFYPAIFHKAEEGGYWISFPDFPECLTQGETIEEAYQMASEAIGLCIDEKMHRKETLPGASIPCDFKVDAGDFTCLIEFDLYDYRKKHNNRAVKKTLSIPEWLNEEACAQGINFSQVLQEALIAKLNLC